MYSRCTCTSMIVHVYGILQYDNVLLYTYKYRLDDESMEIRNLESRGPCAVAFRAQRGRY